MTDISGNWDIETLFRDVWDSRQVWNSYPDEPGKAKVHCNKYNIIFIADSVMLQYVRKKSFRIATQSLNYTMNKSTIFIVKSVILYVSWLNYAYLVRKSMVPVCFRLV